MLLFVTVGLQTVRFSRSFSVSSADVTLLMTGVSIFGSKLKTGFSDIFAVVAKTIIEFIIFMTLLEQNQPLGVMPILSKENEKSLLPVLLPTVLAGTVLVFVVIVGFVGAVVDEIEKDDLGVSLD